MKTIQQIVEAMTTQQRKDARNSIGDALDIVSGIVGDMPYSSLFNVTCAVIEFDVEQHNAREIAKAREEMDFMQRTRARNQ